MANDLKVKITADVKGFKSDIQDAGKSMDQFNDKTNEAGSSIADYQSKLSKSQMNIKSFNKELRQARKDALELGQAFRSLSPDQQMSGFGKQLRQQMDEAIQKAGELTDLKGDIQREIQNIASDTRGFDTAKESISVLMNTMGSLASIYATVTGDQEAYNRAVTIFTGTQQTLNALTAIQNALQKESNLYKLAEAAQMKVINALRKSEVTTISASVAATTAETVAQEAAAAATTKNAVAHKALSAAMKAGPYLIIAGAITAIAATIGVVNKVMDNHKKKIEEVKEAYNRSTRNIQNYNDAIAKGHASVQQEITDIRLLQTILNDSNKTYAERKEALDTLQRIVPDYHASLTREGTLINNNTDALEGYITNLQRAAEAEALRSAAAEKGVEIVKLRAKLAKEEAKSEQARQKLYQNDINPSTVHTNVFGQGLAQNSKGASKYISTEMKATAQVYNEANKQTKELRQQINEAVQDQNNLTQSAKEYTKELFKSIDANKRNKQGGRSGGSNTNSYRAESKELSELIKKRQELQERAEKEYKLRGVTVNLQDLQKQIDSIDNVIKQRRELELKYEIMYNPKVLEKEFINKIGSTVVTIPLNINPKINDTNFPDLSKKISDTVKLQQLRKLADDVRKEFFDKVVPTEEDQNEYYAKISNIQAKMRELGEQLKKMGINVDYELKFTASGDIEQSTENVKQLKEEMNSLQDSFGNATISMISRFKDLGDLFKDTTGSISELGKAGAALSLIGDSVNSLGEGLAQLGAGSEIAKMGAIAAALGQVALGFAYASREAGKMGPYAWLAWTGAGLAALGTMISTIKQIQGYSKGGRIPGPWTSGDRVLIRVNSGERVLTKKQNDRLNNLLENGGIVGGGQPIVLDTVIRSGDIWLTQRQYGKSQNIKGKH